MKNTLCTNCTTKTGCICDARLEEINRQAQLDTDCDEADARERREEYERRELEACL